MSISPPIQQAPPLWRTTPFEWALLAFAALALGIIFWPGLRFMVANWAALQEYSYGYFIPFVSGFLLWQRSDRLREAECRGSWWGLLLIALALLLAVVGHISAIRLLSQYGFIVALLGLAQCLIGSPGLRIVAVPLATLIFMIPLPQFFMREISEQLQLLSSQLGVWLMRLLDISVYLEGNVIDLGTYQLQVVEACSGLRYLFPLVVLAFLVAYFFRSAFWKRLLIVVSAVPLTIVINSLRIALIGITVEHWGISMAEGLLHEFEGFFMFMVCIAALLAETRVLAGFGASSKLRGPVFGLDFPPPPAPGLVRRDRPVPAPALAAALVLASAAAALTLLPERNSLRPHRPPFSSFPNQLDGGWQGRTQSLDPDVLAWLALDDYLMVNFVRPGRPWVNLYSAYYASQSGGESTHSPRTCIPGGGWAISAMGEADVPLGGATLRVNRALIEKADQRQLVYYWFSERGRTMTSEFAVKWSILHDAVASGRTDGALIRLVTPVVPAESEAQADQRLREFLGAVDAPLAGYLPR
jgi:exosortase D (VPLPA-CTERM-specific)